MKEIITIDRDLESIQLELESTKKQKELLEVQIALMLKEMNHFTYIVSHDLQAPLRMVTGFLELLEKKYGEQLDKTAKSYIEYAVKGSVKMKNLIFDLLVYSRLNTIEQEINEVNLNTIFEEACEKFNVLIDEKGAVIKSDQLPIVVADKKQMEQLFHHLISNALKFHESTTPVINISVRKENNSWQIGISDNGIGIGETFFEKIFIVFRRLHSDDVKYSGTGIGLAICKKIIDLHKGKIWVESTLKEGSTFYFTLPVIE